MRFTLAHYRQAARECPSADGEIGALLALATIHLSWDLGFLKG